MNKHNTAHRAAFPGDPAGVRAMRAWLRGYLPGHWPRAVDIELCATELATNAMRHTCSGDYLFAVTIEYNQPDIRLTVEDLGGDHKPDVQPAAPGHRDHGHGLALVQALSDAWGASGDVSGRDIWATFALPGSELNAFIG